MSVWFYKQDDVIDAVKQWGMGCFEDGTITDSDTVVELIDRLFELPIYRQGEQHDS